ncbi:MAG: hypothetical protein GXY67_06580 [Clostridiales bacterium]|nr:hypothetical protein [Clostridiales bacterium]
MREAVWEALLAMRPPFAPYEIDIHRMVRERLLEAGFSFTHEAVIGKGCRIDFLVGDVGIEIKKGKPDTGLIQAQLLRYAACKSISALIVISQRYVKLPETLGGKPVDVLTLPQLWGVALP